MNIPLNIACKTQTIRDKTLLYDPAVCVCVFVCVRLFRGAVCSLDPPPHWLPSWSSRLPPLGLQPMTPCMSTLHVKPFRNLVWTLNPLWTVQASMFPTKKKIPWTYYETYCRIRINFCKISCLKSVKGPFDGSDGTWLIVLNDQWSVWKLRKAELAIILLLLLSRDHNSNYFVIAG